MIEKGLLEENLKEAKAEISEVVNNLREVVNSAVDDLKDCLMKMIEDYEETDEDEKADLSNSNYNYMNSSTVKAAFLCSTYKKPRDALGNRIPHTYKTLASTAYWCQSTIGVPGACPYVPCSCRSCCRNRLSLEVKTSNKRGNFNGK